MVEVYKKISDDILDKLKKKFIEKGKVATGRTIKSLRSEVFEDGFEIWAGGWVEYVEYGRGKLKSAKKTDFYERLLQWARVVGFPETKVRFLQYYINKFGTKMHREGKTAGILPAVLNEDLIQQIKKEVLFDTIKNYKIEIRKNTNL